MVNRCEGIGKGLKVGDKPFSAILAPHQFLGPFNLRGNRFAALNSDGSRAAGITENAAVGITATVTVRATEAGIDHIL